MDGVFSFVIFAGLFYLMMRYGCGAHMAHGHHKAQTSEQPEPIIDPVCNKVVEIDKGYGKLHDGELYRFCSKECLDKFDVDPVKYVTKTVAAGALK